MRNSEDPCHQCLRDIVQSCGSQPYAARLALTSSEGSSLARRELARDARCLAALSLLGPGIIGGIDVDDLPRADAAEL